MGTNIAFLDVMACGLGAAILLFLIVKHHTGAEPLIEDAVSDDREILTLLQESEASLNDQIKAAAKALSSRQATIEANQDSTDAHKAKQAELIVLELEIAREEAKNSALEKELTQIQPHQTASVISDPRVGEEDYLIGLKVQGRRIAILLDRSASMTDAKLVEIIKRKLGSDVQKKQGPKWNRALRVARWLLARLPASSEVAVIAFNDKASVLNQGNWANSQDANQINRLVNEVVGLVPTGATNLEAGLRALGQLKPAPTDIYVVTDGLPTQSVSSPGIQTRCRKQANSVSGRCREVLFETSLAKARPPLNKKVNVILLPMEGDPQAAPKFWGWTASTGGLLLVPAVGWP